MKRKLKKMKSNYKIERTTQPKVAFWGKKKEMNEPLAKQIKKLKRHKVPTGRMKAETPPEVKENRRVL